MRDRSNRLAGILLGAVFIPCLDDGNLADSVHRVYELAAIPQTSLETCVKLYRDELVGKFKGLEPVEGLMNEGRVFGFRTAAGALVPTGSATSVGATGLPVHVDNVIPPWEYDSLIFGPVSGTGGLGDPTSSPVPSTHERFDEAYQHVRLSLAHTLKQNTSMRSKIQTLMGKTGLPLFERRKRMDILLEPILFTWLFEAEAEVEGDVDVEDKDKAESTLRTDCIATTTESECVGACVWTTAEDTGEKTCRIHVPKRRRLGAQSAATLFAARLSDELLRYPLKRRELLEDHVPTIRPPRGIVRVGDELFAEARDADSLLERLGFFIERTALSFPEEMLTLTAEEDEKAVPVPVPIREVKEQVETGPAVFLWR